MKLSELAEFDASGVLTDDETIQHYLALAFEDDDPRMVQRAVGAVAKARGMSALTRDSGITRESLHRALADTGNPDFATIVKVVRALGLRITVVPLKPAHA